MLNVKMLLLSCQRFIPIVSLTVVLCYCARIANSLPQNMGWVIGQWEECNVTCGGGRQRRKVFCAEQSNNTFGVSENRKVKESYCWQQKKPDEAQSCNVQQCPIWEVGQWTQCSTTCDKGWQFREVACRESHHLDTSTYACEPDQRPAEKQVCYTGVSCKQAQAQNSANYEKYRFLAHAPFGEEPSKEYAAQPSGPFSFMDARPHWYAGSWSDCSSTCGPGVKQRKINCMALQQFTRDWVPMPDYECEDQSKPSVFLPCELKQCPRAEQSASAATNPKGALGIPNAGNAFVEYRWSYGNWTECSASCLGGVTERRLLCIQVDNHRKVAWKYCDPRQRPPMVRKTCNNEPCPPRWENGDWSVCSHSCGKGTRTRRVQCIREISQNQGRVMKLILPLQQCPREVPESWQQCNVHDCTPVWKTGQWSQCSKTCGDGEQRRMVVCEQVLANGRVKQHYPPTPCQADGSRKPASLQLCHLDCPTPRPTPYRTRPTSRPYDQRPQDNKIRLKAPGSARIFGGTSLRIRCPTATTTKNTRVKWVKNGKTLQLTGRVKVSNRGKLRIFYFTKPDEGNYTCLVSGKKPKNIELLYKPQPPRSNNRIYAGSNRGKWKSRNRQKGLKWRNSQNGKYEPNKTKWDEAAAAKNSASQKTLPNYNSFRPNSPHSYATTADPVRNLNNNFGMRPKTVAIKLPGRYPDLKEPNRYNKPSFEYKPMSWPDKANKLDLEKAMKQEELHPLLRHLHDEEDKGDDRRSNEEGGKDILQTLLQYAIGANKTSLHSAAADPINIHSIRFEWVAGAWSPCSQTCGHVASMQLRQVKCEVRVGDSIAEFVEETLCADAGLPKPHEAQVCGEGPCPRWVSGNWTDCQDSRCLRYSTAYQQRKVYCVFPNSTQVDNNHCARHTRPKIRKTCVNPNCTAEWRTSPWSECTKSCENGVQMRTIGCYWRGTRKPARNSCAGSKRPSIVRACAETPCPTGTGGGREHDDGALHPFGPVGQQPNPESPEKLAQDGKMENYNSTLGFEDCMDKSRFCSVVKQMRLCHKNEYSHQCCYTCTYDYDN